MVWTPVLVPKTSIDGGWLVSSIISSRCIWNVIRKWKGKNNSVPIFFLYVVIQYNCWKSLKVDHKSNYNIARYGSGLWHIWKMPCLYGTSNSMRNTKNTVIKWCLSRRFPWFFLSLSLSLLLSLSFSLLLSLSFHIGHHFPLVLYSASCVPTELMNVNFPCLANTSVSLWRSL